jgi:hypothetical protein
VALFFGHSATPMPIGAGVRRAASQQNLTGNTAAQTLDSVATMQRVWQL